MELEQNFEKQENQQTIDSLFGYFKKNMIAPKRKFALAMCLAERPLPFTFFDDSVDHWAFNFDIAGETVSNGIIEIFNEFQCSFKAKIKNKKECLAMDGWTNTSAREKHICILLQPLPLKTEIFFVTSTVVKGTLTADALYDFLKMAIESLDVNRLIHPEAYLF